MTETVWVKTSGTHETANAYHTDPDCHALARANAAVEKSRHVLPADLPECKLCAGTSEVHRSEFDPHETRDALLNGTPEEFGLSPRGERR